MRVFLIAAALLLAAPAAAHAADPSLWSRDLPRDARAPAAVIPQRPFDLVGVHWRGSGRVELRTLAASGTWSPWRLAAPEAEDRPDRGVSERSRSGWTVGNPWWAPGSTRLEVRTVGKVTQSAGLVRTQPVCAYPAAHGGDGGLAEDRAEKRLERQREDRAERATLCARAALRPRPPHGRLQLVQARGIRGDRSRHRALPREGQRLERHRLQLSRRPLRPGLRGAGRRDAAQRHRRSRGGVQHRVSGRRCPRDVLGQGPDSRGGGRPRRAARMAPGRRARRSCVLGDGLVWSQSRVSPGHLRTSGRGLYGLSGQRAVRAAGTAARGGADDGAAEALRPSHHRAAGAVDALQGAGSRDPSTGR